MPKVVCVLQLLESLQVTDYPSFKFPLNYPIISSSILFLPGSVVILAIALLGDVFHYIPTASLAAIIIAAVIPVVDPVIVWKIIRLNCKQTIIMQR